MNKCGEGTREPGGSAADRALAALGIRSRLGFTFKN